jgi:hypothetical protein
MSRLPRICPIGIAQHIIQRGNNRQICLGSEQDFFAYVGWLKEFYNPSFMSYFLRQTETNQGC